MITSLDARIAAVVLAAGRSQRMGQPKMLLPWGDTTVIGQVVHTLTQAGLQHIIVVTGGAGQQVEAALKVYPARTVFNPHFTDDRMTLSLQVGLASLPADVDAALVTLGDQPQIQLEVVQQVWQAYQESRALLVFPSYHMRRGHPWIIARPLWGTLLDLDAQSLAISSPKTLREILRPYSDRIHYVDVANDSILRDLDTPTDYQKERPGGQTAHDQEKM